MRSISIVCSEPRKASFLELMGRCNVLDHWVNDGADGRKVLTFMLDEEDAPDLLDNLEGKLQDGEHVMVHALEGFLPRPKNDPLIEKKKKLRIGRFVSVSKNELYEAVVEPAKISTNLVLLVVLSSFVAGIGILQDNTAVVIGAMMIAPLLGPNLSMSFGTVIGDVGVVKRSFLTGLAFTGLAVLMAVLWGLMTSDVSAAAKQVSISLQDVALALMCGFAGTISVLSGQAAGLVGVMVAAALMPPLIRGGLLLGAGWNIAASQSLILYVTNIVSLNLAAVVTFYAVGIRPSQWWEKEKAKKQTRSAFIILLIMLVIVILLIKFVGDMDVNMEGTL